MFCASFSDKVIEHFMNPQNLGELPDADAVGTAGEAGCGDFLAIFIKVEDQAIAAISFLVDGCVGAIASSSMATELAKGKTLDEAFKITDQDIVAALDGLPEHKLHCSLLGVAALRNAITNYRRAR